MKQLFAAIAISLVCFACEKEESNDNPEFFPLSVGNKWTYQDVKNGEIIDTIVMEIKNKKTIEFNDSSYECYFWHKSILNEENFGGAIILSFDKELGLLQMGVSTPNDTLIAPSTMFKYPVVAGDYWDINKLIFAFVDENNPIPKIEFDGTDEYVCTDIDKPVTIGKVTYHCVVYKSEFSPEDEAWKTLLYVAPGYGLVRVERYTNDVLKYEWRLLEVKTN